MQLDAQTPRQHVAQIGAGQTEPCTLLLGAQFAAPRCLKDAGKLAIQPADLPIQLLNLIEVRSSMVVC
jgi:hypothetical protein